MQATSDRKNRHSGSVHMPQRTCISCRKTTNKQNLIRLVYATDGCAKIELKEKLNGRGAYLCREWKCWEDAFKKNRLEQALRGKISQENKASLIEQGKAMLLNVKDD
ncbi:MAG: YlxR family protein [Dehalococcoidia bacterium]|nr:YlxR family protein [Dehalococcoidia bacterium]